MRTGVRISKVLVLAALALVCAPAVRATGSAPAPGQNLGPYNAIFLEGGIGLSRPLNAASPVLAADARWSISGWIRPEIQQPGTVIVVGVGDPGQGACRCLGLRDGNLVLFAEGGRELGTHAPVQAAQWHAVSATYDGSVARVFLDGQEVASGVPALGDSAVEASNQGASLAPVINLAPVAGTGHFGGSVAHLLVEAKALDSADVRRLTLEKPDFNLIVFQRVGQGWPWQEHAWRGLQEPQDPWTLPHARTRADQPVAARVTPAAAPGLATALRPSAIDVWTLGGWRLAEALPVPQSGPEVSDPGFQAESWYPAVVPGTVLTTLIARGVYPDPYHGLNNMVIPESLSRQDYWYRTCFQGPAVAGGQRLTLTFNGINYGAEVWLNGVRLGAIRGAFIRGIFDVTSVLRPGQPNALAVRISPPPHPGIAHEESIAAGPGENGGAMAIDGPTFIATEGWDWIPGIRDRDSGIWQDVELRATGQFAVLDPQVVTRLPLPRTDEADVSITVPVRNYGATAASVTVEARFEGVTVRKAVNLPSGVSEVKLTPGEFAPLHIQQPRLWWPNGYGEPNLYTLTVAVFDSVASGSTHPSDSKTLRFGIRELTYELSLFDHEGHLRRVEVNPTEGTARGERLVDVRHQAIKKTADGWAASLTAAGESSPAVHSVATESLAPYLVIRVNGVPIAVRGGSWGMDDALKRVDRERLEPYFRLHRDAHLNIIRNWLGQDTEEVFYDLADEYGLLVLNDFWVSTQDFQMEPQDPQLFLENARDVVLRYRNHPSIAVWFGRNEGVPQPILNEGLADLLASEDGTRYYTGSSNSVNLQGSGPYNYRLREEYFTKLARGFSVEVGSPSLSTLESLRAMIPAADRWPISDTLAYHDWHFGGNGDVATFMTSLTTRFGKPQSLEDFERMAQMMNLETYRAVFEGFQAHLWTRNSGRLLWMTHPSWPSNMWQIYSSDYDTPAAYYGVKSACEPIHVQMNLPDFGLAVVNTTLQKRSNLILRARVISVDNRLLAQREDRLDAGANAVTTLKSLDLSPLLERESLVLVALMLDDATGMRLSENVYWQGRDEASDQRLNELPTQPVDVNAQASRQDGETVLSVDLGNSGDIPALEVKLTALDEKGNRVLPVYYSDNYITVLPRERRCVEIRCPKQGAACTRLAIRGWNVQPRIARVGGAP